MAARREGRGREGGYGRRSGGGHAGLLRDVRRGVSRQMVEEEKEEEDEKEGGVAQEEDKHTVTGQKKK